MRLVVLAVFVPLFAAAASTANAQPPPAASGPTMPDAAPAAPDLLAVALAPQPGGLTPDEVARAAARTHNVRAKQEELHAAAARVDQALIAFFPRATVTASYTRLSFVDNAIPGALPITLTPGGLATVGSCGAGMAGSCVVDSTGKPLQIAPLAFPFLQNQYSVTGSISVPVSDYVLRLSQGYAAASHAEQAKRLDAEAEALQGGADGKIVFYNWVRSKGQVVVTTQAVEAARAHVVEAKRVFDVGLLSKADVLRLEAQVATAEQLEAQAEALETVAGEQLRIVLGVPQDQGLSIGADVLHAPAPVVTNDLAALTDQALAHRLEVRALDETIYSLKRAENANASSYFPRVDAFADGQYADPNLRYIIQTDQWRFTWDVGVRATWTINDTFNTFATSAEARSQTRSVVEKRAVLRDGVRLEVASAVAEGRKAAASVEAAERGLLAAEESLRVRRELFKNGKATSVELIDSETEATRARLQRLDAHVDVLVAKARIDHAIGRDAPAAP